MSKAGMLVGLLFVIFAGSIEAALYLNELHVDPQGKYDVTEKLEYIELRGTPGLSLNGFYLIFLESENNPSMGVIQNMFDLNGRTVGNNGFFSIRMNSSLYPAANINPAGTNLIQGGDYAVTNNRGFGRGFLGTSTVGYYGEGDPENQSIENGATTCLLIQKGSGPAPQIGDDLDPEEITVLGQIRYGDGELNLPAGWTVIDSIGVELEGGKEGEADGCYYGWVNFGCEDLPYRPAGSSFLAVSWGENEIEYLGRWGNSTGYTVADWMAANLTTNPRRPGGYSYTTGNLVISASGDNHEGTVQCTQSLPYGTIITNTLGGPNIQSADANIDGKVDVSDLGILAANYGLTVGGTWAKGDFNGDFKIDVSDLGILAANYGAGTGTGQDFKADAKAFGLSVDAGKEESPVTSTLGCGLTGLPMVAGLFLAGAFLGGLKVKE